MTLYDLYTNVFYRIPGIVNQENSLSDEQARVFYSLEYIIRKEKNE